MEIDDRERIQLRIYIIGRRFDPFATPMNDQNRRRPVFTPQRCNPSRFDVYLKKKKKLTKKKNKISKKMLRFQRNILQ